MLRTTDEAFKRMENEYEELEIRCFKLEQMIKQCRLSKVHNINLDEIHLMEEQYKYMMGYLNTLSIRIARVKGE